MKPCILIALLLAGCGAPVARTATIVQTISAFNRPESVAFSLDGKHLFVSNCASGLFGPDGKLVGFVRGKGAISKLEVLPSGRVKMVRARFIQRLSGSVGLAVMPISTQKYPAGTLSLSLSGDYSPVASFHKTYVNRMPVRLFLSRSCVSEGPAEAEPFMMFDREPDGRLRLYGYALPSRGHMETYFLGHPASGKGKDSVRASVGANSAHCELPIRAS